MKKIALLLGVGLMGAIMYGQDTTEVKNITKKVKVIVTEDENGETRTKEVIIEGNESDKGGELKLTTIENDSTKKVLILKGDGEEEEIIIDEEQMAVDIEREIEEAVQEMEYELERNFGGKDSSVASSTEMDYSDWSYLSGLNIQMNLLLNDDNTMDMPAGYEFLKQKPESSVRVGLSLFDKYIPIAKNNMGIVTGLDLDLVSYGFKKGYVLSATDSNLVATEFPERSYSQNKLRAAYFKIPLMLQFATGKNADKSFHFGVGGYGGLRIASKTKEVYTEDGRKRKDKTSDDYNLNGLQYGLQAMVGYGNVSLRASYSLSNTFDIDGLNLRSLSTGVTLHF